MMRSKPSSLFPAATPIAVAILVGIKVYLLGKYGVYKWGDNDGMSYINLADQLLEGKVWTSVPDLATSFVPASLLRLPGYALLIAAAKLLAAQNWLLIVIGLQLIVSFLASCALYHVVSLVSGVRLLGLICATGFALSYQAYYERFVLTDSIYASVFTMALCYLVWITHTKRTASNFGITILGLSFAAMFLLREMTLLMAIGIIPLLTLSVPSRPRFPKWLSLVLTFMPLLATVAAVLLWNVARVGQPVITVGASTALTVALADAERAAGKPFQKDSLFFRLAPEPLLTALVKLETAKGEIFTQDVPLDELARKHFKNYSWNEFIAIGEELRERHGLTAPEIARLVTNRYFKVWLERPDLMLKYVLSNMEEARYVLHSPFVVKEFGISEPTWKHPYVSYLGNLFDICFVFVPLIWSVVAVFVREARPIFYLCGALALFTGAASFAYAAISMDMRYVLPTIAPILLIVAVSVGATRELAQVACGRMAGVVRRLRESPLERQLRGRSGFTVLHLGVGPCATL